VGVKIQVDERRLKERGYGLEAIRRLKAGFPIVYMEGGIVIEEHPDGRRYEIGADEEGRTYVVREIA
jgi:hypothetical protein